MKMCGGSSFSRAYIPVLVFGAVTTSAAAIVPPSVPLAAVAVAVAFAGAFVVLVESVFTRRSCDCCARMVLT